MTAPRGAVPAAWDDPVTLPAAWVAAVQTPAPAEAGAGAVQAQAGTATRARVVAEARSWMGTPWQHQARLKGVGVDCAGLIIGVARALGLVDRQMDVQAYARKPDGVSLLAHCDAWMHRIDAGRAQPGDVIVIRFDVDPQHLALLGDYAHGGLSMIHSIDRPGVRGGRVEEHRYAPEFRACTVAAYRLPGVVDA